MSEETSLNTQAGIDPSIIAYFKKHDFEVKIGDEYISHDYPKVIRVTSVYLKENSYNKNNPPTMTVGYEYLQGEWHSGTDELKDFMLHLIQLSSMHLCLCQWVINLLKKHPTKPKKG